MNKNSNLSILLRGILLENPVFVLILGTCPTLATSTTVIGAVGMGIAAMAVLVCSNIVISLLRKVIRYHRRFCDGGADYPSGFFSVTV